jgi:HAD superfamily hydrolase (TIGR01509 family)
MIKHILFDLGNVLIEIHPHLVIEEFAEKCNLRSDYVRKFYLSYLHLDFMEGRHSPPMFYQMMMEKYPCNLSLPEFRAIWNKVIGQPKDGIAEIISQLQNRYVLSVCSNTDAWHWQKVLDEIDFIKAFTHYFLSFRLKHNKPHRAVYEAILNTLPASGEECFFIDDTEGNILAAKEFGIRGVVADNAQTIRTALKRYDLLT